MLFNELRVLELASVLAGPSVGQFFAELGAEVIKVENRIAGGDVTRTWKIRGELAGDLSAYFCSVNWGKKSIALDLTTQEDRDIVYKLMRRADIVITSYKPGDAVKLGVDYEFVAKLKPEIIYGEITGYGRLNDRVGYDAIIQAESGFMDLNGEAGGPPLKMPVALVDVLAGHHLKEGLLIALLERERTGKGSRVEVSLLQAAVASLVNQASNWLVAKQLPVRQGSAHPNIAPYGEAFTTADGRNILLAVGSDRQFVDLCSVLELKKLATDLRFITNAKRVENREELSPLIRDQLIKKGADEWMRALNAFKIPAGIIKNMREVFETQEAQQLLLKSGDQIGIRSYVASTSTLSNLLPPPHLGEHSKEIMELLEAIPPV